MELPTKLLVKMVTETGADEIFITPDVYGLKLTAVWYHENLEKKLSRVYSFDQFKFAKYPLMIFEEFIHAAQKATESITESGFGSCESSQLGYISARGDEN